MPPPALSAPNNDTAVPRSKAPEVSVILCSRNRAAMLRDALEKLAAVVRNNPATSVEIVIVNNGATDDTAAVISAFVAASPDLRTRPVYAAQPGLAAARNAGLQASTGAILMFCDDDGVLADDYFTVLQRLYANDQTPVMRGGRVLLGDPADLPYTIKPETVPATYQGRYPGGFIHGCNMTFSRSVYERIGLMDERFGAGALFPSADESDYIHRAYQAGVTVLFCPELVAYHYHGRRDPADIRRLFDGYMIGDGALFAKHWNNGLLRCLLGNVINAFRAILNPSHLFDKTLGFSYRDAALGNLRGFFRYWLKG